MIIIHIYIYINCHYSIPKFAHYPKMALVQVSDYALCIIVIYPEKLTSHWPFHKITIEYQKCPIDCALIWVWNLLWPGVASTLMVSMMAWPSTGKLQRWRPETPPVEDSTLLGMIYHIYLGKFHHDLTVLPSPGIMVYFREIIQMAELFRLVKYYNLPSIM